MPHVQTDNQPVTQITVIEPEAGQQAEALSLMTERARFMARQPGFISVSLHRSLDGHRIVKDYSRHMWKMWGRQLQRRCSGWKCVRSHSSSAGLAFTSTKSYSKPLLTKPT